MSGKSVLSLAGKIPEKKKELDGLTRLSKTKSNTARMRREENRLKGEIFFQRKRELYVL